MGKRLIEVLDQRIQIRLRIRHLLHLHIAVPHRLRHPALAHVLSDHRVTCVDGRADIRENLLIVCFTAAEARGAKQENLFVPKPAQQLQACLIRRALVRPETHIDHLCIRICGFRLPEVRTPRVRQCPSNRIRELPRVARPTAENNGISLFAHRPVLPFILFSELPIV